MEKIQHLLIYIIILNQFHLETYNSMSKNISFYLLNLCYHYPKKKINLLCDWETDTFKIWKFLSSRESRQE